MVKPTDRFTQTVSDYVRYRPSYPSELVSLIEKDCGLTSKSVIADIGSGTGLLTQLFLAHGNPVYGVEPNTSMREAGETFLKNYPQFHSVAGSAEHTTLSGQSIDLITVGTAFHWFEATATKNEFLRILKSPGYLLLVWNVRDVTASPQMRAYDALLAKYGTDFKGGPAEKFEKSAIKSFFAPYPMQHKDFTQTQLFDWAAFKGRLLSSSFIPRETADNFSAMITELKSIYDSYQKEGFIKFSYCTKLFYGRLR